MNNLHDISVDGNEENNFLDMNNENKHLPVLVLDLDETIIFSFQLPPKINFFQVKVGRRIAYVTVRPGFNEFIEKIVNKYEVFVYTASNEVYADQIISSIMPMVDRKHILSQKDCYKLQSRVIKDLTKVGRTLQKIVLIDDRPSAHILQEENLILITPWRGDQNDNALLGELLPLLDAHSEENNVVNAIRRALECGSYESLRCLK